MSISFKQTKIDPGEWGEEQREIDNYPLSN